MKVKDLLTTLAKVNPEAFWALVLAFLAVATTVLWAIISWV